VASGMVSVEAVAAAAEVPPGEPDAAAEAAGLLYISDDEPGVRRVRCGRGFTYRYPDGTTVPRGPERERIEGLAIPPAWTDVWICLDPDGHLQATGRDTAGRKQYRYHERWREIRDATKFHRLGDFGECLPLIRDRVDEDLRRRALDRDRVLAIVVALLDESLIRIGNEAYLRDNETHGLTTLRQEHAEISSTSIALRYQGKGGQDREVDVRDRRLARQVARCAELPGQCLFSYEVRGEGVRAVESGDVNRWLQETCGAAFTSKDFRTWGGTVVAATTLHEIGPAAPEDDIEASILAAVDAAAERLGNTREVARTGYIHPKIAEAYRVDRFEEHFAAARARGRLVREEDAVLRILDDAW
jgi:DNA topoisomerase I